MNHWHHLRIHELANLTAAASLLAVCLCGCSNSDPTSTDMGTIATIAGTGEYGYSGDGGPATAAQLNQPTCAVMDSAGNLYIGDVVTYTVRKVAAGTGIITTYAGNGIAGYSGGTAARLPQRRCTALLHALSILLTICT